MIYGACVGCVFLKRYILFESDAASNNNGTPYEYA